MLLCLQPDYGFMSDSLPSSSVNDENYYADLGDYQKVVNKYSTVGQYYYNKTGKLEYVAATQAWVWDILPNNTFTELSSSFSSNGFQAYYDKVKSAYDHWESNYSGVSKLSSTAPTTYLEWNESNDRYQAVVTSNPYGFLDPDYTYFNGTIGKAGDYTFEKSGNNLIVFTKNASANPLNVTASFKPYTSKSQFPLYFNKAGSQSMVSGNEANYTRYFNVQIGTGDLNLTKKAQSQVNGTSASTSNGNGFKFEIYEDDNGNGVINSGDSFYKTVSTGSDGTVSVTNMPIGDYILKEVSDKTNYVDPGLVSFSINAGKTTTKTITNNYKTGILSVYKGGESFDYSDSGDVSVSGVKFSVKHKETGKYVTFTSNGSGTYTASGESSSPYYVITNGNGDILLKNLRYGNYEIIERSAPSGYIISGSKSINLDSSSESISFSNDIIKVIIFNGFSYVIMKMDIKFS